MCKQVSVDGKNYMSRLAFRYFLWTLSLFCHQPHILQNIFGDFQQSLYFYTLESTGIYNTCIKIYVAAIDTFLI